jgi:hypothetical protein
MVLLLLVCVLFLLLQPTSSFGRTYLPSPVKARIATTIS